MPGSSPQTAGALSSRPGWRQLGARLTAAFHWIGVRRKGRFSLLFLAMGLVMMLAYIRVTPYDQRSHDVYSHLEYMEAVHNGTIPEAHACWECHQPPAYYALADAVLALYHSKIPPIVSGPHPARGGRILQRLSVAMAAGMLFSWLLTIERMLKTPYERVVASALVTFWPSATIETCKLGNDTLVALLISLTLWQLVVWSHQRRALPLVLAGVAAGLAVLSKANGLLAVGLVGACIGGHLVRPPTVARRLPRGAFLSLGCMSASFGLALWMLVRWKHGEVNPTMPEPWRLSKAQFFHFDVKTFLATPYAQWGPPGGDQFWSFLLRTSLFGGESSSDPLTLVLSWGMLGMSLVFTAVVLAGLVMSVRRAVKRDDEGFRPTVLACAALLSFIIYARVSIPWSAHNDFRLVLPLIMPCGVMFGLGAGALRRRLTGWPHLAALLGWLVVAFCLSAVRVVLFWP